MSHGVMTILVATKNRGKLAELQQLFADGRVRLIGQDELDITWDVAETGATFAENAVLKAQAGFARTGLPTIADDSGLCVDALQGRPGVLSARYGGPAASDADRNATLLAELRAVPPERRSARFVCAAAYIAETCVSEPLVSTASCEGRIIDKPLGTLGFGYDPIFYVDALGKTFAQADPAEKHRVSHRGQAMRNLARALVELYPPGIFPGVVLNTLPFGV